MLTSLRTIFLVISTVIINTLHTSLPLISAENNPIVHINGHNMVLNRAWNWTPQFPNIDQPSLTTILQEHGQIFFFTGKTSHGYDVCRYLGNITNSHLIAFKLHRLLIGNQPQEINLDQVHAVFFTNLQNLIAPLKAWDYNRVANTQSLCAQFFPLTLPLYYTPAPVQSFDSSHTSSQQTQESPLSAPILSGSPSSLPEEPFVDPAIISQGSSSTLVPLQEPSLPPSSEITSIVPLQNTGADQQEKSDDFIFGDFTENTDKQNCSLEHPDQTISQKNFNSLSTNTTLSDRNSSSKSTPPPTKPRRGRYRSHVPPAARSYSSQSTTSQSTTSQSSSGNTSINSENSSAEKLAAEHVSPSPLSKPESEKKSSSIASALDAPETISSPLFSEASINSTSLNSSASSSNPSPDESSVETVAVSIDPTPAFAPTVKKKPKTQRRKEKAQKEQKKQEEQDLLDALSSQNKALNQEIMKLVSEAEQLTRSLTPIDDPQWDPIKKKLLENPDNFCIHNFDTADQGDKYASQFAAVWGALVEWAKETDKAPTITSSINLYLANHKGGFEGLLRKITLLQKLKAKRTPSRTIPSQSHTMTVSLPPQDAALIEQVIKTIPPTHASAARATHYCSLNTSAEISNFLNELAKDPENNHIVFNSSDVIQQLNRIFKTMLNDATVEQYKAFLSLHTIDLPFAKELETNIKARFEAEEAQPLLETLTEGKKRLTLAQQVKLYMQGKSRIDVLLQFCQRDNLFPTQFVSKNMYELVPWLITPGRTASHNSSDILLQIQGFSDEDKKAFETTLNTAQEYFDKQPLTFSITLHRMYLEFLQTIGFDKELSESVNPFSTFTSTTPPTHNELRCALQSWLSFTSLVTHHYSTIPDFYRTYTQHLIDIIQHIKASTTDDSSLSVLSSFEDTLSLVSPETSTETKVACAKKLVSSIIENSQLSIREKNKAVLDLLHTFNQLIPDFPNKESFLKETLIPSAQEITYDFQKAPNLTTLLLSDFSHAFTVYREKARKAHNEHKFYFTHSYESFDIIFQNTLLRRAVVGAEQSVLEDQLFSLYYIIGLVEYYDTSKKTLDADTRKIIKNIYDTLSKEVKTYSTFCKPTFLQKIEIDS